MLSYFQDNGIAEVATPNNLNLVFDGAVGNVSQITWKETSQENRAVLLYQILCGMSTLLSMQWTLRDWTNMGESVLIGPLDQAPPRAVLTSFVRDNFNSAAARNSAHKAHLGNFTSMVARIIQVAWGYTWDVEDVTEDDLEAHAVAVPDDKVLIDLLLWCKTGRGNAAGNMQNVKARNALWHPYFGQSLGKWREWTTTHVPQKVSMK